MHWGDSLPAFLSGVGWVRIAKGGEEGGRAPGEEGGG